MSGFDYSKWDNIELSDDEDDLHPNIDKESWFRLKHRTRLEREEKEDNEVKEYSKMDTEDGARKKVLQSRIKKLEANDGEDEDAEFEDIDALKGELQEIEEKMALREKRVNEINERRKWNIDNICKVSEERTIVTEKVAPASLKAQDFKPTGQTENAMKEFKEKEGGKDTVKAAGTTDTTTTKKIEPSSSTASTASTSTASTVKASAGPAEVPEDGTAVWSYNDYVLKHEEILETYSEIEDMEKTQKYVFSNCDVLLHEHSQSYMLLSSLEDEMNGKKDRMKLVCRQAQILSHIQELAVSMGRDPRDVVLPFFDRIGQKEYLEQFLKAVKGFVERIRERAIVKRKEMDAERGVEVDAPLGPGGLDPGAVFRSLPKPMQDAFESQSIDALKAVLAAMEESDAKYWMKQCVDSGLWVANSGDDGEEEEEMTEEEKAKVAKEMDPLD
jgi:cell division cycle protein 37